MKIQNYIQKSNFQVCTLMIQKVNMKNRNMISLMFYHHLPLYFKFELKMSRANDLNSN
jgi:hypothetical protein